MSKVRFVKPEDAATLHKYLDDGKYTGLVLIFPSARKFAEEQGITDGLPVDYDFGGNADVWTEIVDDEDHYFFSSVDLKGEAKDEPDAEV